MRSRHILVSFIIITGAIVSARLASASSTDDQSPDLEAPIAAPVVAIPAPNPAESSATPKASPARNPQSPISRPNREIGSTPRRSAVLAVPGLDGNIPPPRRLSVPNFERVTPERAPGLAAPLDLNETDDSSNLPLELETERPGSRGNLDPSRTFTEPTSRNSNDPTPRTRTGAPSTTRRASTDPRASNLSRNSSVKVTDPPPRRGFFGLFRPLPPRREPAAIERRPSVVSDPVIDHDDGVIAVEPARPDPATDDALKRRIERQARAIGGDRLRTLDVKVKGKRVLIRATANRFWQRRGLRNDLQTLQALAGLQSQVDVVP